MEEVVEEGLKTLQKWEGDRLRAVKTGESQIETLWRGGRGKRERALTRRRLLYCSRSQSSESSNELPERLLSL